MELIAIADTHIKEGESLDRLPATLISMMKEADMIVHAGSFDTIECYNELSRLNRLAAVHDEMDTEDVVALLPDRLIMDVEEVRLGVIHRGEHVTTTTSMRYLAKEMGVDVLIFGHLHKPVIDISDVLLLCPGSPTFPRMSVASAVLLRIDGKKAEGKIIACGEGTCFS
ncbi:MAG TPA: metallophosphoesterase [Candidatus Methanoperedenaceae archaeon]|nr:metallophosphoesterase [Candidatus Methanoperedenaceae archaeon]